MTLLSGCTRREGGYIWASAQFVLDTGWVQFAGICISRWFWFCPVLNSELTLGHRWKCIGYFEYVDTGILDQSRNIDLSIFFYSQKVDIGHQRRELIFNQAQSTIFYCGRAGKELPGVCSVNSLPSDERTSAFKGRNIYRTKSIEIHISEI